MQRNYLLIDTTWINPKVMLSQRREIQKAYVLCEGERDGQQRGMRNLLEMTEMFCTLTSGCFLSVYSYQNSSH